TPPDPPLRPILTEFSDTGEEDDDTTNQSTPTFVGIAEPNSRVRIYSDGVAVGNGVANGFGDYEVATVPLAAGPHVLTAKAIDAAGNASAPSAMTSLVVD